MIEPWLTIPAEDVRVIAPYSREGNYNILFKDSAIIDKTITELQRLKVLVAEMEKAGDKNGK